MSRVAQRRGGRWKNIKQRLGIKGMASCCGVGAPWGSMASSNMSIREENSDDGDITGTGHLSHIVADDIIDPACVHGHGDVQVQVQSGMNLAAALAAERQFRAGQELDGGLNANDRTEEMPSRMSLMRLLHEIDGRDEDGEKEGGEKEGNCCVCMGRRKGAAFIPCGHTFCRVCSREIWLNRGTCPLCNRSILEILDIF